jgi:hypothetical protein
MAITIQTARVSSENIDQQIPQTKAILSTVNVVPNARRFSTEGEWQANFEAEREAVRALKLTGHLLRSKKAKLLG